MRLASFILTVNKFDKKTQSNNSLVHFEKLYILLTLSVNSITIILASNEEDKNAYKYVVYIVCL